MATRRRLGAEGAKNRELLVEATGQLLREEGYAAVTARRVAERAGLKVQLVYYYFETMDEVIVALVRKNAAARKEKIEQALLSAEPLRALWQLNSDPAAAITTSELLALANHRESIRAEIVLAAREMRSMQIDAVSRVLAQQGLKSTYSAGAIVTIGAALGRALAQDCALGVSEGYAEALMVLEEGLRLVREGGAHKPA